MKRPFLTLALACLAVLPLSAQVNEDSLALLRAVEKQNYAALSAYAADLTVVASKKVPRGDFFLWLGHLREGSWGADGNWYPQEAEVLYLSLPSADSSLCVVQTRPLDTAWSRPEVICPDAASRGSEIFPMLSPDGQRLYFASNGLSGMGGYDLYVARWDAKKQAWGSVQNLGFPYNSKGDDLLFCDTPDGRYSLLVSNRDCGPDEVVIYVLRQEVPVFRAVKPEEAAARERLAVTAPDNGYPFEKQSLRPVPALYFEQPEPAPEPEPVAKKDSKKKTTTAAKNKKADKKKSSVKVITEEVRIVK
ncbi:MAG: PD40 domain-containing protein [Bacteroidales bacterium]|nr:PD40 domain-containing protein [Bacteroidales bacterium]